MHPRDGNWTGNTCQTRTPWREVVLDTPRFLLSLAQEESNGLQLVGLLFTKKVGESDESLTEMTILDHMISYGWNIAWQLLRPRWRFVPCQSIFIVGST